MPEPLTNPREKMMQPTRRRTFLTLWGLMAGGVALGGLRPLIAAETSQALAQREVAELIARYARLLEVQAGDAGHPTEFRVKLRSQDGFAQVFDPSRLPFERVYAGEGNLLEGTAPRSRIQDCPSRLTGSAGRKIDPDGTF